MPCSCGSETCPCGIPCYCLEESCKCPDCAMALDRLCKMCCKSLITDTQTDEGSCSCFVGESTALILENRENIKYRLDNIPKPIGYFVHGKLIANVMIPVLPIPQLIIQQPINLMPLPSIQKVSENILPPLISDIDQATPLLAQENFGSASTSKVHQLDKCSGQLSSSTSSSICSTGAQNTEISCKDIDTSSVVQSVEVKKTVQMVSNAKSETERDAIGQDVASIYLPSIKIGNISYPVGIADRVWTFPNPVVCVTDSPNSCLKLYNPFYVAGKTYPTTHFEEECHQPTSSLNFDSNFQPRDDSVAILKMNEQPLERTELIGKSNMDIRVEGEKFEDSIIIDTERKFAGISLLENANGISVTKQTGQHYFNTLRSNEIPENHFIHGTSDDASNGISHRTQEFSDVQSQPVCPVSISASVNNDYLRNCSINSKVTMSTSDADVLQNRNFWCPIPQSRPEYFKDHIASMFQQPLFNNRRDQSSKENDNPQRGYPSSPLINKKNEKEIDPIPLYIDTFTTQKMERILKPVNSRIFPDFR